MEVGDEDIEIQLISFHINKGMEIQHQIKDLRSNAYWFKDSKKLYANRS